VIDYSYVFDFLRNAYAALSYYRSDGKALMPLRYVLEITHKCNLRCPYCYVGEHASKNEMTTQNIFDIIDQIPPYALITLVGGEPLIRPDFLDIFEHAAAKAKVNVTSNGMLLNEKILNSFIKNNLLLLSVSLDGWGETHDKNRACSGAFDKTYANLELVASKKKRPLTEIKSVMLENNLDDLPKLYKMCDEMKFDFFSISFVRNNSLKMHACLRETFTPEFYTQEYPLEPYFDMEHFRQIHNELISLSKKSKTLLRWSPKFSPRVPFSQIENFWKKSDAPISQIYKPCMMPYSNMFINPQGDVYPCLSVKTGNIIGKKISDVHNTPAAKCFRKNLKSSKVFNACQLCCELVPCYG
jgi:radical SAM protein with 4Fe4S-binding SPASM domain